jgi:Ran GTPase-activating protein (RanGAP) involved in mRNA processing and transport
MEGAQAIASLLKEHHNLKSLHLIDAGLDCDTLLEICSGISETMSLEYLDLRQNIFDKAGLQGLIKALEKSMTIKHLYLESM